jgi:F-type H+-transporting ATPase subunit delta
MHGAVARRYAEALFEAARQIGADVEMLDGQAKVLRALYDDPQVRNFFTTPQIPAAKKKEAAQRTLEGRLDALLINLLKVLIDHNRAAALPEVCEHFDLLTDQSRGVEEVEITSAVALSDAQREAITSALLRFSAYGSLRVDTKVDPAVLGGVKVRLGQSQVLDGTVAARLAELRASLS